MSEDVDQHQSLEGLMTLRREGMALIQQTTYLCSDVLHFVHRATQKGAVTVEGVTLGKDLRTGTAAEMRWRWTQAHVHSRTSQVSDLLVRSQFCFSLLASVQRVVNGPLNSSNRVEKEADNTNSDHGMEVLD